MLEEPWLGDRLDDIDASKSITQNQHLLQVFVYNFILVLSVAGTSSLQLVPGTSSALLYQLQ